jgi:hypothetical protein
MKPGAISGIWKVLHTVFLSTTVVCKKLIVIKSAYNNFYPETTHRGFFLVFNVYLIGL